MLFEKQMRNWENKTISKKKIEKGILNEKRKLGKKRRNINKQIKSIKLKSQWKSTL